MQICGLHSLYFTQNGHLSHSWFPFYACCESWCKILETQEKLLEAITFYSEFHLILLEDLVESYRDTHKDS